MDFFTFFQKEGRDASVRILMSALCSGIINGLLIMSVIQAAQDAQPGVVSVQAFLMFAVCFAGYIYTRHYVMRRSTMLTEEVLERLRLRIVDKLRKAGLGSFEKTGTSAVYTALAQETRTIQESANSLMLAFPSLIMLIFAAGYVFFLSMHAFVLSAACIGMGVLHHYTRRSQIGEIIREVNQKENTFFDLVNQMLNGFKENKLNLSRNDDMFDQYLRKSAEELREARVRSQQFFYEMNLYALSFFYLLIGLIIFGLPVISSSDTSFMPEVAAVILFIFGALTDVVAAMPAFIKGQSSIDIVLKMESALDAGEGKTPEADFVVKPLQKSFREIDLKGVGFHYSGPDGTNTFQIGPVDLKIGSGELIFLVGGNGSGKSTLLKVLTGLYPPMTGKLLLDGHEVGDANASRYRSLFASVFADFNLFDRLYGVREIDREKVDGWLERLELQDKTAYAEGCFTETKLSTGQRKRLAFIVAVMEDRPILILDELAADQDPDFRRKFYREIMPELVSNGKTILAATHDDHYFDVAHRILRMEYGQLKT